MAFPEELVVRAAKATAESAVQTIELHGGLLGRVQVEELQEIAKIPATIAEVSAEEGWRIVIESLAELVRIQTRVLDGQRKGQRETRLIALAAIAVSIIVPTIGIAVSIIMPVIIWWLGR